MKNFLTTLVVTAFISLSAFGQIEIDNNQNVGIGIATPTQKLDVNGQLRIRTIPLDNVLNEILVRDASGVVHYRGLETFSFWNKSGTSLFPDSICMVGIGTLVPQEKLHVKGDMRVEVGPSHVTILKIASPGEDGVGFLFDNDGATGSLQWRNRPQLGPIYVLQPQSNGSSLVTSNIGSSGQDGVRMTVDDIGGAGGMRGHLEFSQNAVGYVKIDVKPRQLFPNSFLGVSNLDSINDSGVELDMGSSVRLQGINPVPGGLSGRLVMRPDRSALNGGSSLTVSNIGSSGLDGVRIVFDADTNSGAIAYHGFDPDPDNNCAIVMSPSTKPNTSNLVVSNIGSSGLDGVRMRFDSDTSSGFVAWEYIPFDFPSGGGGGTSLVLAPREPAVAINRNGQLVVSNIGSSGQDGVSFDTRTELRLGTHDTITGIPRATTVAVKPTDNTRQVSFDSFFDIFVDAGECRYRAGRIDTNGFDGTGILLSDAHQISGVNGGGGAGGSIWLQADITQPDGGSRLKVSNLGSSGCDGVSIDLGEDARIEGRNEIAGGGGGGGRLAFIFDDASTDQRMLVSNIGSSGLDGVGFSDEAGEFWFENLLPGVHNPHGGALRLTPRKLPSATGNDRLTISNIGSSGCDGVSIDVDHAIELRSDNAVPANPRATTVRITPLDTGQTPAATYDSFFDIFVDAGECRYRAVDNSSDTTEGTGMLLHDKHLFTGIKPTSGGAGGSILFHPDVTQQNGGSKLKVSNLGSSGCDGVSISNPRPIPIEIVSLDLVSVDPITLLGPRLRMHTSIGDLSVGNTGSAGSSGISLIDESPGNTGGHLNFLPNSVCLFPGNGLYSSVMARIDGGGLPLGVRMTLDQNLTALEPAVDFNKDGSLDLVVRRATGGNNGQLTVSNIGSSGDDGVRMALSRGTPTTVPVELVALSLESIGPLEVASLDNGPLAWSWGMGSTDQRLTQTVQDNTPGSTATPHVFEYDGFNNSVRVTGPPTTEYESNQLKTETTQLLDGLNRVIRELRTDESQPTLQPTTIEHIFPPSPAEPIMRLSAAELHLEGLQQMILDAPIVQLPGALDVSGDICAGGIVSEGAVCAPVKNFLIDHPLDPYNKNLRHVSVESPEMMNIYNGNVETDSKGFAIVAMPDYFSALNMDFRYQLTVMGTFAQAIVKEKISDNKFVIQTDKPNVEVSWQVSGIRNDTYAKENKVQVEEDKKEAMKGKLLYEPKNELGLNK